MGWMRRGSSTGIDLGRRHIVAVQVGGTPRSIRIERAVRFSRSEPGEAPSPAEASRIARVLARHQFRVDHVVVGLSPGSVRTRALDVPATDDASTTRSIVNNEIARLHGWADGQFEVAHWHIPAPVRSTTECSVMTVGCSHDQSETQLRILEPYMPVHVLDAPLLALVRACDSLSIDDAIIASIERDTLTLVFLQGGVVTYGREIETQPRPSDEEWKSGQSGRAWIESLVRETRTSLEFFRQSYPDSVFDSMVITGEGACRQGVCESMGQVGGLSTRVIAPSDLVSVAEDNEASRDPAFVLAFGHALCGWR